jgi:hypothetical protein
MIRKKLTILMLTAFVAVQSFSQSNPEITAGDLRYHIGLLASDSLGGRYPGTPGDRQAEKYIAARFSEAGLKLLCNNGLQEFKVVTDTRPGKNNKLQLDDFTAVMGKDFTPLSFSTNCSLKAPVVFAGYGFDINLDSLRWNDYAGIDVNGKWVMVLRGDPEPDNPKSLFADFESERVKALTAKDKGAQGVIFVTPEDIDKQDVLMHVQYDRTPANAGILVLSITRSLADHMLATMNDSIGSLVDRIKSNQKPSPMYMPVILDASAEIEMLEVTTANIVGIIQGNDPQLADEYIVIGAHHDHLGIGGPGSGSRRPDTLAVHNGADDNASGAAGVIELAQKLSANRQLLKRPVIIVAFAGEEMGLLGSKEFVKNPPVPLKQIKAMINLDMIGRLNPETNTISIGGTGTSVETDTIINLLSQNRPFKIGRSSDGYGPSDHASFYSENIPVFYFTSGAHEDYHTPSDDAWKINYDGEVEILDMVYDLAVELSGRNEALTFKEAGSKQGVRYGRNLKVTLGIVPDMVSSDNDGLGVDGVRKGGPAESAGIRKGDKIVSLEGQTVTNIYDYMARLSKLKPGQVATVEIIRDGKKQVMIVQL